jgi:ATP adenylyltransferase
VKQLWAPWRLESLKTDLATEHGGCIFCLFPGEEGSKADRDHLILARSAHSFVILNRYPYNNGHLMVVPRRHTAEFTALPHGELSDLHRLLQDSVGVVTEVYQPAGFNIGMNVGKAAGAGIADHLHYHLVPRWMGDTNFMPLLAETKVLVEHLMASYDRLKPRFDLLSQQDH